MTIEHIEPLKPIGKQPASDEQVLNIGNLMLVGKEFNNKLANKSFASKKKSLAKSKLSLDPILQKSLRWTKMEIDERARWLAKQAYEKVWKL